LFYIFHKINEIVLKFDLSDLAEFYTRKVNNSFTLTFPKTKVTSRLVVDCIKNFRFPADLPLVIGFGEIVLKYDGRIIITSLIEERAEKTSKNEYIIDVYHFKIKYVPRSPLSNYVEVQKIGFGPVRRQMFRRPSPVKIQRPEQHDNIQQYFRLCLKYGSVTSRSPMVKSDIDTAELVSPRLDSFIIRDYEYDFELGFAAPVKVERARTRSMVSAVYVPPANIENMRYISECRSQEMIARLGSDPEAEADFIEVE